MSGAPIRGEPVRDRVLTEAQSTALADQLFRLGVPSVHILSYWGGSVRWGRNRVALASDRHEVRINLGAVETNQFDSNALTAAVQAARRLGTTWPSQWHPELGVAIGDPRYAPEYPTPAIWSEATYQLRREERGRVVQELIGAVEPQGMFSAGYLAAEAQTVAIVSRTGRKLYGRMTQARFATTVRDSNGTGSGWAGKTSSDWARIDAPALGARALKKCLDSRNPVTLEPGRYTVVLEPQAVADLLVVLFNNNGLNRLMNETFPNRPFYVRDHYSKLGLKVADERVTIGQDPLDPELGSLPFAGHWFPNEPGDPYRAVNWIENGILKALAYDRTYSTIVLPDNLGLISNGSFRMAGGPTSIQEMIATTKRGLLVTRFWDVQPRGGDSVQSDGLTRDGLWLIENGRTTKPVKNFRFVDSPLLVLNRLEQIGPAEPVFRPGGTWDEKQQDLLLRPAVVPPLKVRDFNFTSLVDAV